MQSKQSSYNTSSHTYNTRKNKQVPEPPQTSLPPSQPILPKAPLLADKGPSDYNLIEKLKVTPTKISLWDFIQIALMYQSVLQEALQKILLPSSARLTDVDALMDHIHADVSNITFDPHEFLPSKVRNLAHPLMIIVHVNGVGIRQMLVDTSFALKFCGLDLLPKIKVDPNYLATSSLFI